MSQKAKRVLAITWNALFAVILVIAIVLNTVAIQYDSVLRTFLGTIGGGISEAESTDEVDTAYYKADYTEAELVDLEEALNIQIAAEGTVLLKNDGALPLAAANPKVSLFGYCSVDWQYTSTQSGGISGSEVYNLKEAFEQAGYQVNETLWDFYKEHQSEYPFELGSNENNFTINEIPQSVYTDDVRQSYAQYSDLAVVVLERVGGEGGDIPQYMSKFGGTDEEHYLELSATEKELLQAVKDSGAFDHILVLVNSGNTMELGFLDEEAYGIDACLWTNFTGLYGVLAIPQIINGTVNPSGHLVDTYVYDNFSSPASQNFGDFRYLDSDGNLTNYSYVNYGESIYVGYRYYETRYEDFVTGAENVGSFDYASEVQFPFGYGLSYTTFDWSDYQLRVEGDTVTVTLTVTNVGNVAGKDAVGVYYQAPYTDYDRENLIETASVNLGNYAKTDLLQPGESQSMEITFAVDEMKSYDYKNSQTYVLEAGDYYVTAAPNAHQAINNILSAKGYGVENGMTSEGESGFVDVYSVNATSSLNTAKSGAEITNIFDFATVSDYAYLTRQNWLMMEERGLTYATGTMNSVSSYTNSTGTVGTVVADAETLTLLQSSGWETSGRPSDQDITETNIVVEAQNGLELVDLRGADYDDPRWDDLLDEMTFQELYDIYTNGSSGTNAAQSINKPATAEVDGPSGISNYISGEGVGGFCSEVLLGSTWNQELAYLQGTYLGNNSVLNGGSNGWYAPAVNIHRTPFGGRNDEYFSEDPMLSGMMASQEIKGIQHYGVYTFIKHFALNEQETNRGTNGCYAAYATEQAIREIYLKPFEIAFTYGSSEERENSLGVMVSMNRIGAINTRGCYALLTSLLRNEWGFQGSIITDACNDSGAQANQDIAAGVNYIMNPGGASFSSGTIKENRLRNALRDSAHHYLYVIVNSNAMNGMYNGAVYTEGTPVYWLILIATDVAIVGIIVLSDVVIFRKLRKKDVEEVR